MDSRLWAVGPTSHWLKIEESWVLIGQSIRRVLRARRGEAPGTPGSELDLSLADERRVLGSDWSIH